MRAGDVLFALFIGLSGAAGVSFADGHFSESAELYALASFTASLLTAFFIRCAGNVEEEK